jgi:hypothetical protein
MRQSFFGRRRRQPDPDGWPWRHPHAIALAAKRLEAGVACCTMGHGQFSGKQETPVSSAAKDLLKRAGDFPGAITHNG